MPVIICTVEMEVSGDTFDGVFLFLPALFQKWSNEEVEKPVERQM